MIRFIFMFLLLLHGGIHLLGFFRELRILPEDQLSAKPLISLSAVSAKVLAVLWLFTCLVFLISAVSFLLKKEWWMLAVPAVLLSQVLIILYWRETKFGTIANIILLVGIVLAYGNWRFNTKVRQELQSFLTQPVPEPKVVTTEMLQELPPIVQKWLHRTNIIGKELIHTVHLQQKGEMRTKPNGNWMPVAAEQYFTVNQPGFIWIADVKAAPFVHLAGQDKYQHGHGHMRIKLLSLFPVANARGKEIDQSTLLRYLAETIWFPTAALNQYIQWESIDNTAARATMSYGGVTASGIFKFNPAGDVISFEALCYYDRKEGATLENWFIRIDANSYQEFGGIRIPPKAEITWKLKTGDFTWFRLKIIDVTYNEARDNQEQLSEKNLLTVVHESVE